MLTKHRYQNRKKSHRRAIKTNRCNAGEEGSVIVAKVAEGRDFGYNAKTDEYVNMLEAGIIDPTK
jgi:chaperonin GroEL